MMLFIRSEIIFYGVRSVSPLFNVSLILWQILTRLCSHPTPAEELVSSKDLQLLFSAVSSFCPAYNHKWRKSASDCLTTVSRHGLTPKVVSYIHGMSHMEPSRRHLMAHCRDVI